MERKSNAYSRGLIISLIILVAALVIGTTLAIIILNVDILPTLRQKYIADGYDPAQIDAAITTVLVLLGLSIAITAVFVIILVGLGITCAKTGRNRIGVIVLSIILAFDEIFSLIRSLLQNGFTYILLIDLVYIIMAFVVLYFAVQIKYHGPEPIATMTDAEVDEYNATHMDTICEIDLKDYDENAPTKTKFYVKGIVIFDNRIGVLHSKKYDFYHLPSKLNHVLTYNKNAVIEALTDEGLNVDPKSITNYGKIIKKQKGKEDELLVSIYYYYIVKVNSITLSPRKYINEDESFVWENGNNIIDTNYNHDHGEKNKVQKNIELEADVIKKLKEDQYIF